MGQKINDLKIFMNNIVKEGYSKQIQIDHLKFFIARDVGVSDYKVKEMLNNLLRFGFLEDVGVGVYKIIKDGYDPTKKVKVNTAKIEKEADDLVKNIEGADK